MIIVEDSRQKVEKHEAKNKYFGSAGLEKLRFKLPYCDYVLIDEANTELCEKAKQLSEQYETGNVKPSLLQEVSDLILGTAPLVGVDTKQTIHEVISDVISDHERFAKQLEMARKNGIQLVILVENKDKVNCINDLYKWYNYRLRKNPKATKGRTLAKILAKMEMEYDVMFAFCKPDEAGKKVLDILKTDPAKIKDHLQKKYGKHKIIL